MIIKFGNVELNHLETLLKDYYLTFHFNEVL